MLFTPENWTEQIPEISTVYNPPDKVWEKCFIEHKKYKKEQDCYYSPSSHDNKPKKSNVDKFLQRMKKEKNKENNQFYHSLKKSGKVSVCYVMNNGGSSRHLSWNVEGN